MHKYLLFVQLYLAFSFHAISQTYNARVFKCDAERVAVFQANYTVLKDGVLLEEGKTYFDGGLSVPYSPKSKYKITISYPGYKDTTLVFNPDEHRRSASKIDTVCLQKNGMRLFGTLMDASQDLPIKDAVLILRNIMTRSEVFLTTSLDGYFNFKLDYETNYQLKVDKYSPGILNTYQDTSFYISTIGFTLPLDFKLNVYLSKARGYTTPRDVSYKVDSSKIKPVLALEKPIESVKAIPEEPIVASIATKPTKQADSSIVSNMPIAQLEKTKETKDSSKPKKDKQKDAKLDAKNEQAIAAVAKRDLDKINKKKQMTVKQMYDSATVKEMQVLEARKRIEEQNKILYEKKKRETYEATQTDLIAYYEKKLKSSNSNSTIELAPREVKSEKVVQPKTAITADMTKPHSGKVMLYGNIYNGSNQLKLANVTVSARPINSIFSKEMQSDDEGNFKMEVDSGQIFVLSFFKTDFKISKQLVDLSDKADKLIKIQDVYLSESMDVEISKDMPVLYFEKNKSELSESITEELNALSVLLRGNKSYTIRLIGLAASDETFTKPLSTSRVSQVAQYLVSAKVPQDQIKFTALGDTKRRSSCGFSSPCTTQDYNNDRVVIYIISQ
jgi:outer membrane protein OmpA-like peptidoglycan-associated protein